MAAIKQLTRRKYVTDWNDVPVVIDVAYVANIIGMSYENTRRLIKNGDIPAVKVGLEWRISKEALMAYLGVKTKEAV